jgi:hypothetical protein
MVVDIERHALNDVESAWARHEAGAGEKIVLVP